MKKILFTGGGSAGHVQPNIAIMEDLIKNGEAELCYMGSDGIEKKLVAPLKIPYFIIDPPKLKRSVCFSNLKIPFAFKKAVEKAQEGLRAFQPSLVFSKGIRFFASTFYPLRTDPLFSHAGSSRER